MKEKIKFYGSIFILLIFVPYLVTLYVNGGNNFFHDRQRADQRLEEQVLEVLAAEISPGMQMENLKAQAVIVRTNLCRLTAVSSDQPVESPVGWSEQQRREAWGEAFEETEKRFRHAVEATKGEILVRDGAPIFAAYHYACNGRTRSAAEVPGQETYAYLVSVESAQDILADDFLNISYMEKEEMAKRLRLLLPDAEIEAEQLPEALHVLERDGADYVTRVKYKTTVLNGEAVRKALELPSSCYYLSELEGKVRILCKGIGHGLGYSQYGADYMAKNGCHYEELLLYYFKDVQIDHCQNE